MKAKYSVEIYNEDDEYTWYTTQQFKTRQEIVATFDIPLYIVDKMIKINNDPTFTTKRNSHRVFHDMMNTMKIHLIKPNIKP